MEGSRGLKLSEEYAGYVKKKYQFILLSVVLLFVTAMYAVSVGSIHLSVWQVLSVLFEGGRGLQHVVIWNIRLPRLLAAVIAGAGLSVAGSVMQCLLKNPLGSPYTFGVSQGAAFGAAFAIVILGAGSIHSSSSDAVIVNSPLTVTGCAFLGSVISTVVILLLTRFTRITPQAMILAGVAMGSLFTAGTMLVEYFATDIEIASIVFWTFGDVGRATWRDVYIMAVVVVAFSLYAMLNRWNYNALDAGEDSAKSLGVDVEKIRIYGMLFASLVTAVAVSFLGIIGFVGLVAPHIMRRIIGSDHRFLIPASVVGGGLLLLMSDTVARRIMAPVVLPVGIVTSFMGAPLFLYILTRRWRGI